MEIGIPVHKDSCLKKNINIITAENILNYCKISE